MRAAEDGHALQTPAAQPGVVVDEPDYDLAGCLTQLTQQAPSRPARTDDQRAPTFRATQQRAERAEGGAFPEARRADQHGADDRVDDEDAAREVAPDDGRRQEAVGHELGRDDRGDDGGRVTCARVPPDAAVEPEGDESRVARE